MRVDTVGLGVENNPASIENYTAALETPHVATIYDLESSVKYRSLAKDFSNGRALFNFPAGPVIDEIVTPMTAERGIAVHANHTLRAIDVSTRTAIYEKQGPDGGSEEVRQSYDLLHVVAGFRTPGPLRSGPLTSDGKGTLYDV